MPLPFLPDAHHADDLVKRDVGGHRDDVGARHHDVLDLETAETEQVAEQGAFVRVQRLGRLVVLIDEFLERFPERGLAARAE